MAYFNQEMKKLVTNRLKENFPGWKFSVKVSNHNQLMVAVKSAPLDLWSNYVETVGEDNLFGDNGSTSLNHYYLNRAFSGECLEKMEALVKDMNLEGDDKHANYSSSTPYDDYPDVGYFISLRLGLWDKPFEHIPEVIKKKANKM